MIIHIYGYELCEFQTPNSIHIKPKHAIKKEKINLENKLEQIKDSGNRLLLCINHDVDFDRYWVTFDNQGNVIISKTTGPEYYSTSDKINPKIFKNKNLKYISWQKIMFLMHKELK